MALTLTKISSKLEDLTAEQNGFKCTFFSTPIHLDLRFLNIFCDMNPFGIFVKFVCSE